jgi:transposase
MGSRGYFVASSGNVTDEVIAQYIEMQDKMERARYDDFSIGDSASQLEMDKASVKIVTGAQRDCNEEAKNYTAEEKVRILRRHLIDHVLVSDLCDELGLEPTVFYRRQKEFVEHGTAAFERQADGKEREFQRRIEALQAKVRRKDEVLVELMEEHIALKKSLGEI